MSDPRPSARRVPTANRLVWQVDGSAAPFSRRPDELAVEEPLEIRITTGGIESSPQALNVTMRTPGHDFELACGWLLGEGIVDAPDEIVSVRYCTDPELDAEQRYNVVTVDLSPQAAGRLAAAGGPASRLTVSSSSCGVCGTASIEALTMAGAMPVVKGRSIAAQSVLGWPDLLRTTQAGFAATGGLHAAGLVSADGELLVAREDIGRHNALDKVAGWAIRQALEGRMTLPLSEIGLVVSGRSSFEIVQKAVRLGVPVVAGVSAASSLAARLADELGLCLAGFVRNGRCTVYSHPERLV